MIDVVLLFVIAASALLGLLRGFVSIVIGTVSWLAASTSSVATWASASA